MRIPLVLTVAVLVAVAIPFDNGSQIRIELKLAYPKSVLSARVIDRLEAKVRDPKDCVLPDPETTGPGAPLTIHDVCP